MVKDKIYCYVDETGQDTKGRLFIVSVIIAQQERTQLTHLLEDLEKETGKKATKWQKTKKEIKEKYIKEIFTRSIFRKRIFYSFFQNTKAYKELTVFTIAASINAVTEANSKASIFIDGLQKSEVARVSTALRKLFIHTEKVKGIRDESNALVRLADAIAGFIREHVEKEDYTKELYRIGIKNKVLKKV